MERDDHSGRSNQAGLSYHHTQAYRTAEAKAKGNGKRKRRASQERFRGADSDISSTRFWDYIELCSKVGRLPAWDVKKYAWVGKAAMEPLRHWKEIRDGEGWVPKEEFLALMYDRLEKM